MAGGKLWTKEEDAILIDCYSKFMSVSEIQKLISRPSGSIFWRAQRLGLTKNIFEQTILIIKRCIKIMTGVLIIL